MKKKYVAVILAVMMAASLTACGSTSENTSVSASATEESAASGEAKADTSAQSTEETASGDTNEAADQTEDTSEAADGEVKNVTTDGVYKGSLYLPNEGAEDITGNVYDLAIGDGSLTLSGELVYNTDESSLYDDDTASLGVGSYSFTLSSDVTYTERGGEEDVDLTEDEFISAYKDIQDSGLVLIITVENGVVTNLAFSS